MSDPVVIIERASFANAWASAVEAVMRDGEEIIFGGKFKGKEQYERKPAKELEVIIKLEGNALREAIAGILHPSFPTKEYHKQFYISEWDRGYDWKRQGFTYCYEDRCEAYKSFNNIYITSYSTPANPIIYIDQWRLALEDVIQQIETGIQSNRNVIVIGNPALDRNEIPDSPPCLREIWIRWDRKNGVDIKVTWRSRDLHNAWMTNIIGLLSAVTREIIMPLTKKYGKTFRISSYSEHNRSLHIYKADWDAALKVKKIAVNPQTMR